MTAASPAHHLDWFSSPYPDPPPVQQPQHNLFHGVRLIDNTWLDEEGDEVTLPLTMADDRNCSSQHAQAFFHDANNARSQVPENIWGDDDDDKSSGSNDSGALGCEMPGATFRGFESNKFAPYVSKTVSNHLPVKEEWDLTSQWYRCLSLIALIACHNNDYRE